MKKHVSIILALVMVFSCLALVSCGKKDEGKAPSADGTAVVTTTEEATGTWTEKTGAVHVKAGDTDADFPAEGDNLVLTILTAKVIFEKQ